MRMLEIEVRIQGGTCPRSISLIQSMSVFFDMLFLEGEWLERHLRADAWLTQKRKF